MPGYAFVMGLTAEDLRRFPVEGVAGFLRSGNGEIAEVSYQKELLPFYERLRKNERVHGVEEFQPDWIQQGASAQWRQGTVFEGKIATVIKRQGDKVVLEIREGGKSLTVSSPAAHLKAA